MTELTTMSVHALSERVEELEQQLAAANRGLERVRHLPAKWIKEWKQDREEEGEYPVFPHYGKKHADELDSALASPAAEPDIHCDTLSELRKLGCVLGIAMPESLEMMRPSLVKQIIRRTTQLFEQQPAPATELNGTISALIECCRKICFPMVSAESHKVVKELQAALNRLDQPAPATEPANPLPANWRALLQHELDVQAKHYGQMAACASAGSRFHAGERDCTEGVIKGIEYCIDILSEAESKPAPVAQSEQEKGQC